MGECDDVCMYVRHKKTTATWGGEGLGTTLKNKTEGEQCRLGSVVEYKSQERKAPRLEGGLICQKRYTARGVSFFGYKNESVVDCALGPWKGEGRGEGMTSGFGLLM